ncbi:hypothetical protein D2V07_13010 [Aurantiacibacter zhengii]|uniref:Uncharacterized protein n=1 Tax=Aurantiacibacter zhengii TaxID=2307003 RepID=A0A418NR47_9SPHN|nr:hypothetical protein D2V07_13010 [Aurantiacibacter zhengii]
MRNPGRVFRARDSSTRPTNRAILARRSDHAFKIMERLEKTMAVVGADAQRALLDGNRAFAPPDRRIILAVIRR